MNSAIGSLDLVENSTLVEMRLLGVLPAPEHFVDCEQCHLGKLLLEFFGDCFEPRTIIMFGGDLLSFGCIEKFQIFLRHGGGAMAVNHFVHPGNGRLGEDTDAWINNLEIS